MAFSLTRDMVREKRSELKNLDRRELIDRIVNFSDQKRLDFDDEGKRREYPTGKMAKSIQENGYQMSDNQYYTLIHHFAADTIPIIKTVGVTFRQNNAATFEKTFAESPRNGFSIYDTSYHLEPEPTNAYDPNAVKVLTFTEEGMHHLGYLPASFVAAHPILEPMDVPGAILDYSNGKFKRCSYQMALDTEFLDRKNPMLSLTDADLMGIGDLGLDMPNLPDSGTYAQDSPEYYIYELPFTVNGKITDTTNAAVYVARLDMRQDMSDEFTTRGLPDTVADIQWSFQDEKYGLVTLQTVEPLTDEQKLVADAYIHHLHTDGYLATHLREQDFMSVGQLEDTFAPSRYGFRLTNQPLVLTDGDLDFGNAFENSL